jgi:putative tryptophan/tyrosine transport system substrate-binding protein
MRRRDFLGIACGAAAFDPFTAKAQQTKRIAFFGPGVSKPSMMVANYKAFLDQLRTHGFIESQNLAVRYGETEDPRGLGTVGAELVQSRPDLIVVSGTEAMLRAVLASNSGIPIVLLAINFDPIERGYLKGLSRPGANITGVIFRQTELSHKQLELLHQALPQAKRIVSLYDAQTADQFSAAETSAKALGLDLHGIKLENPPYNFDDAFKRAVEGGAQALLIQSSPNFIPLQFRIDELTRRHRLPGMFTFKPYVESGGLMSYGVQFTPMYRRTADYVARILRGAKPADLPAEQAINFEMVINLKTAKAIGVELPTAILLRSDHVIE